MKVRDEITILPAVWRKHSCLRVHGTFPFRVPVPPGFGHRACVPKELATGKSPLPADKNVGATERDVPHKYATRLNPEKLLPKTILSVDKFAGGT